MNFKRNIKVAIVYDRVNKWGGAERVLLALHEMYPNAPLYTSVYDKKNAPWAKVFPKVITSFLQNIPLAKSNHEFFAPFMPFAFSFFDFSKYDIVISVTSEFAKGVKTNGKTIHICYCLTPTRYLWSHYDEYFKNQAFKTIAQPIVSHLRKLDLKASSKPDLMISISNEIQKRIKKYYKRRSEIVFPPVEISKGRLVGGDKKYYLVVGRLVKYKKVDLVVKTFNELGYSLVVVGTGREEDVLKSFANKNIQFVGKVTDKKLKNYYKNARALIMPQEEDFGIVAVEAQLYGVPVIAYNKGGARDTVVDGKTGIFFKKQNTKSLNEAILRFEKMNFKADNLITNAKKFSQEKFKREFGKIVNYAIQRR